VSEKIIAKNGFQMKILLRQAAFKEILPAKECEKARKENKSQNKKFFYFLFQRNFAFIRGQIKQGDLRA
jgi:hypothetical protein